LSLQASGLRLKETKSEFLKTEIEYFSKNGITPNNKKIPSILKYTEFKPQTELEYASLVWPAITKNSSCLSLKSSSDDDINKRVSNMEIWRGREGRRLLLYKAMLDE
jgi:hypothetical protein